MEVTLTVTGAAIESCSRAFDLVDNTVESVVDEVRQTSDYKPTWPALLPR